MMGDFFQHFQVAIIHQPIDYFLTEFNNFKVFAGLQQPTFQQLPSLNGASFVHNAKNGETFFRLTFTHHFGMWLGFQNLKSHQGRIIDS